MRSAGKCINAVGVLESPQSRLFSTQYFEVQTSFARAEPKYQDLGLGDK